MPQLLSPVGQSFQPVPTELKSKLDQGTSFGDNFASDTFHIRHFSPFLDHDIAFAHRVPRAASLDYWGKSARMPANTVLAYRLFCLLSRGSRVRVAAGAPFSLGHSRACFPSGSPNCGRSSGGRAGGGPLDGRQRRTLLLRPDRGGRVLQGDAISIRAFWTIVPGPPGPGVFARHSRARVFPPHAPHVRPSPGGVPSHARMQRRVSGRPIYDV